MVAKHVAILSMMVWAASDPTLIHDLAVLFYKDHYRKEDENRPSYSVLGWFPHIGESMKLLNEPVIEEEVHRALWVMNPHKALAPTAYMLYFINLNGQWLRNLFVNL